MARVLVVLYWVECREEDIWLEVWGRTQDWRRIGRRWSWRVTVNANCELGEIDKCKE
jgi:hypothetical protein